MGITASGDAFIAEPERERIDQALAGIERDRDVRILLAVESGSRAWRFPSRDSDYDVRFIYAHRAQMYMSIDTPPDVIEYPTDGILDINGWDIRKALQLLVRSNAVLLEWLTSPVRYRDTGKIPAELLSLARRTCYLPALAYHYDRLARHSLDNIVAASGSVRLKTYCYALRPVLALLWIRRRGEAPPMDLPTLLAGVTIPRAVHAAATALVEQKAATDEQGMSERLPVLDEFLAEALAELTNRFELPDRATVRAEANEFFASVIWAA